MSTNLIQYSVGLDDKLSPALGKIDKEADSAAESMDGLTAAEKAILTAMRDATKAMEAKAKAAGITTQELKQLEAETKRVAAAEKGATKATTDYSAAAGALSTGLLALGAALGVMLQGLADYHNLMNDSAVETRLTAGTLQALSLAVDGGGDSLEQILPGLKQLPKLMNEAAKGAGPAAEAFKALGVEVTDANDQLRSADDVFRETVGALNRMENETKRSALGTILFTEASGKLLKNLGNVESLDAFSAKASVLGPDLTAGAQGAADFQRSMADLDLVLKGTLDTMADVFGGTGGGAGLIDDFVRGVVFAREIVVANINNMMEVFKALFEVITSGPRAIIAAWKGDDIGDALMAPFERLKEIDFLPITKAIEKTKELAAAQAELNKAQGAGAGGDGGGVEAVRKETAKDKVDPAAAAAAKAREAKAKSDAAAAAAAMPKGDMGLERAREREIAMLDKLVRSGMDLSDSQIVTGMTVEELRAAMQTVSKDDMPYMSEVIGQFVDAAKTAAEDLGDEGLVNANPMAEASGGEGGTGIAIAQNILGVASGGFSAITGLLSGFGPVGALIGAILSLLSQGAQGIFDAINGITDMVMVVLHAVPDILVGLMPVLMDLVNVLLSELPGIIGDILLSIPEMMIGSMKLAFTSILPQLILLIPRLIAELYIAFPTLLMMLLTELPKAMLEAFVDLPNMFAEAFADMFKGVTDGLLAFPDMFDTLFNKMPGLLRDGLLEAIENLMTQIRATIENFGTLRRSADNAGRDSAEVLREAGNRQGQGPVINFQGLGWGDDRQMLKRLREALLGNSGVRLA